jgi:hypothetical protein
MSNSFDFELVADDMSALPLMISTRPFAILNLNWRDPEKLNLGGETVDGLMM